MSGESAVLGPVDRFLAVLDSSAYRKGLLFLPLAQGKVKLPAMMGDHMVLQQNSSVKLWGWADGKKVTVTTSWNNRTYQASTDKDGAWLVKVDTPKGGYTPYSITISDGTPVTLSDILIGEVWICSGQSNMEMRMMGNAAQHEKSKTGCRSESADRSVERDYRR